MQEAEFLKNGGDISWLQGLQHLPKKMLNLLSVNKTLAHQPWFVSPELVKVCVRVCVCVCNIVYVCVCACVCVRERVCVSMV